MADDNKDDRKPLDEVLDDLSRLFAAEEDRHQYWILNEAHETIPTTMFEWSGWFEHAGDKRIVKQERVGPYFISTVFLGLNHNFMSVGPPILFETMVFHGKDWDRKGQRRNGGLPRGLPHIDMERCSTWEQAEAQHKSVVDLVRMIEA